MSRILFVLGAGASKEAGVPTMADFFERANEIHARHPSLEPDAFRLVAKARATLQRAQSKAQFDLRNLESVFGAFEMAHLLFDDDSLGALTGEELSNLSLALRRVIVATIEQSMQVAYKGDSFQPPRSFGQFAVLVAELLELNHDVAIVTFNYDIGIELGLAIGRVQPDYSLREQTVPALKLRESSEPMVPVLKLHGSMNWTRCTRCGKITVRHAHDIIDDHLRELKKRDRPRGPTHRTETFLEVHDSLGRCSCWDPACDKAACESDPAIIPPTAYKLDSHKTLQRVWRSAARRLREAEAVFVIGYSWPLSDHFFHNLFAVGSVGDTILSRFWVCNPDPVVVRRFRDQLLGQQARDCFGPPEGLSAHHFKDAIGRVAELYGVRDFETKCRSKLEQ